MQDALSVHIIIVHFLWNCVVVVVIGDDELQYRCSCFSLAGGSEMLNDTHTIRQFLCHEARSG
jgi:hypothetical protein